MTVSELIPQQRHTLHTLHNAMEQYRQHIARAQERLERTLEQIQAEKAAAEQEAKREYEQARDRYIRAVLDHRLPKVTGEKQAARETAREELRAKLLSTMPSQTAVKIDDISSLKSEMVKLGAGDPKAVESAKKRLMTWITLGALFLATCAMLALVPLGCQALLEEDSGSEVVCYSIGILTVMLFGFGIFSGQRINKWGEEEMVLITSNLSHLAGLYHRYLELAAQQAQTQNVEAQRVYQQSLGQVKQQFLDSLQQLRPIVLGYTTLADQSSPPWQSEAWQNWRLGTLTPGVVRLGVFALSLDQLTAK